MFNVEIKTTNETKITVTITIADLLKIIEEKCVDIKDAKIEEVVAVSWNRELILDQHDGDYLKIVCKTTTVS